VRSVEPAIIAVLIAGIAPSLAAQVDIQGGIPDYALVQELPLLATPDQTGAADLTGDGHDDIYCALKFPDSLEVFVNDGTGALQPAISIPLAKSLFGHGVGDFTGDGIPDLALGLMDLNGSRVQVLPGNGTGAFLAPTADISTSINIGPLDVGDLNGDGALDVAVTYIDLNSASDMGVRIYLGDGLGQLVFSQDIITAVPPFEVAIRDLDLDGLQDLVISTAAFGIGLIPGTLEARLGIGGGAFGPMLTVQDNMLMGPMRVALIDGDAIPDIAIQMQQLSGEIELRVYQGVAAGAFQLIETEPLVGGTGVVQETDIDADGDRDILLGLYDFMTGDIGAAYLPNDGTAHFGAPVSLGISGNYSAYSPIAAQLVPGGSPELALGRFGPAQQLEIHAVAAAATDEFVRADANADGALNIADAVSLLNFLFVPGTPALPCADAGDANDDEALNIADAVRVLDRLFVPGSPPIAAPFPACGEDPTAGALGCAAPPCP